MENSSELKLTQKWIKYIADGSVGHEIEASSTKGIRVVKAHKGFILCDLTIHNGLLDQNGNWYVGEIATLVDTIGAWALHFTMSLLISLYHITPHQKFRKRLK
ncbi:putative HotDog domain-containing protein [Lupinus albus]|uniref:Putative HotDog domain-containing protein n=1 Tax=Lupinus albus TaxID=3870 RepID=A0A6A4R363_LUPAL|nr:putative HotDog domain-containing protein [Lupinus albus]